MWKAFHELIALGLITGPLPRFICMQEEGCQPIVDAMAGGAKAEVCFSEHSVSPTGLRVPFPPDLNLIVSILKETDGTAIAINKNEIKSAQQTIGICGISSSPEGAATLAGLLKLYETDRIARHETVILFNTSHALKYYS